MGKSLTNMQEDFCRQYIKLHNAAKAARLAGYSNTSSRNIGCKLLKREDIQLRLKELKKMGCYGEVTEDFVIDKLVELLNRCLEPKPVTKWDSSQKANVETGVYTFDSRGAIKALEQLAKHLGMTESKEEKNTTEVVNIIEDIG